MRDGESDHARAAALLPRAEHKGRRAERDGSARKNAERVAQAPVARSLRDDPELPREGVVPDRPRIDAAD